MSKLEKAVETEIRVELNRASLMVMKNRIEACYQCGAKPKRTDALGLGSADLVCVVPPYGRFLAIECKREKGGRLSEDQERWLDTVRRYQGVAGVARSIEEAFKLLDMARKLP